ncbi:MAG TPA: methyl-accepting chemotaxis protein [Burkholderiales bacterium]|nr:methyl-accepting chemotaxis protein [Burkholderiales bacterium]
MNLRTSLQSKLLVATVGALGVVIIAALAGIAGLWSSVKTLNETSHVSVGQERSVRDMTVNFKEQVQEWKNVLLRGKDPQVRDKYWAAFVEKEAAIDKSGKRLVTEMTDSKARDLVGQFLRAHRKMGEAYRRGLQAYKDGGFDSAAGDAAVKGIDRAPTELLESAAHQIQNNTELTLQNGFANARAAMVISIAAMLIALMVSIGAVVWLVRTITLPLKQLVGLFEATSTGDFSQRLQTKRGDELGILVKGYNRMAEELVAIVGQVQKSAVQVGSAVTEIAAGAKEQEATAVEVTATATEISATSKQIASTSKELLKTMNEVSEMAEKSSLLTSEGQTGLNRMEGTMGRVMEATDSINAKLAVLNEKAGNISKVTTTITKVADQTNLLSLNAAIEAEKAGEYGRGFAVVATEIRRLADQTAVASYDIEVIVKEIQSAVSASVMGMNKFSEETRRGIGEIQQVGGQLSQVIEQVQTLIPRFEVVNEGMRSQTTGAEQITGAFSQLTEAMRQAADAIRQSNVAIAHVSQVADGLSSGVSRFKLA